MSYPWYRLCVRRRADIIAQKTVARADRWRARPEERRHLMRPHADSEFDSDNYHEFSDVITNGNSTRYDESTTADGTTPAAHVTSRPRRSSARFAHLGADAVTSRPDSSFGSRDFVQLASDIGVDLSALESFPSSAVNSVEKVLTETLAAELPPGWSCHRDLSGQDSIGSEKCYYYNNSSDCSQYEHPFLPLAVTRLRSLGLLDLLGAETTEPSTNGGWNDSSKFTRSINEGHTSGWNQYSSEDQRRSEHDEGRNVHDFSISRPVQLHEEHEGTSSGVQRRVRIRPAAEERPAYEVFGTFGMFASSSDTTSGSNNIPETERKQEGDLQGKSKHPIDEILPDSGDNSSDLETEFI
eukprot:SAG31_NODE_2238_length_6119_cov_3.847508_4_plen_354_part_00